MLDTKPSGRQVTQSVPSLLLLFTEASDDRRTSGTQRFVPYRAFRDSVPRERRRFAAPGMRCARAPVNWTYREQFPIPVHEGGPPTIQWRNETVTSKKTTTTTTTKTMSERCRQVSHFSEDTDPIGSVSTGTDSNTPGFQSSSACQNRPWLPLFSSFHNKHVYCYGR